MKKLCAMFVIAIMLLAVFPTAVLPSSAAGPQKTALTINTPTNVYSKQAFAITGKLIAGAGTGVSDMSITIQKSTNGKTWTTVGNSVTDADGYYTVSTSEGTSGVYLYRASFAGNKLYKAVTSARVKVAVDSTIFTGLTLTASPDTIYPGDSVSAVACLMDGTGNPISGKYIHFDFGGCYQADALCDASGHAYCTAAIAADPGTIAIVATYDGGWGYAPATSTATVEVKDKPLVATTLTLDQPGGATAGQPITFTGSLTAADGAVMYGQEVHVQAYNPDTGQWDNIAISKTNGLGAFTASATISMPGTCQVWAVYDGGDGYAGDTSDPKNVDVEKAKLATPSDLAPPDGSTYVNVYPRTTTLSWSPVEGADSYLVEIEFYSRSNNVWISGDPVTATGTSYTFNFPGDQPGRWRVTALDSTGLRIASDPSAWSTFEYKFDPSTTLTFAVEPVWIYQGEDITFSGKLTDVNGNGIAGKTIKLQSRYVDEIGYIWRDVPGVTFQTDGSGAYTGTLTPYWWPNTYEFRTVYVHEIGVGYNDAVSNVDTLEIREKKLAAPTLVSPENGAEITDNQAILKWSPVPNADSYEVCYWGGMIPEIYKTVYSTECAISAIEGMNYREWKVRALDSTGACIDSEWSAINHFILEKPKLAAATLVSPVDRGGFDAFATTLTFTWEPVPNADTYVINFIPEDGIHDYISRTVTETSCTIDNPSGGWYSEYAWQVSAYNSANLYAASYSPLWHFTIGGIM
ncbi:MAG: hypothetical protein NC238_00700 [Dehalobacter sp.]|nr:hypothetical protein [Dehalobacter sp.]